MTPNADQLIDATQANMQILQDMTTHVFSGVQTLMELNLAAARTSMIESFSHTQACLNARDAQQWLALQTGLLQPMAMKYVSYRSQAYAIAADTCADMIRDYSAAIDNIEKKIPAAEPVVGVLKGAASASQAAIETAQNTARKAVELVESNLAAVDHHPAPAAAGTARKRGHSAAT